MTDSKPQHLSATFKEVHDLEDCQVSCMIQIRNHIIIGNSPSIMDKQPAVKLFTSQCHLLDIHKFKPKSSIKDMINVKNSIFAVLTEDPRTFWIFFSECTIDLLEITEDEKLKFKNQYKFEFKITAFCYANNLYFLACEEDMEQSIKVYENLDGKSVKLADTTKQKFGKRLTKMHVDKNYRMIISDSNGQVHVIQYTPITQHVTVIKRHKFTVSHIEPLPNSTILLATAGNTSIVKLLPDSESTDNNFIETHRFPCGMCYNTETAKLRVAVKVPTILDKIFWNWFTTNTSRYKIQTYQLNYGTNTDTIINM